MNDLENFNYINLKNFNKEFGLDNGEKISNIFKNALLYKVNNPYISFKNLHTITNKNLIITGTNLNNNSVTEYFSHISTPDMPVWLAIRITTAFPILYTSVKYNNTSYVDGALSSHCPIEGYEYFFKEKLITSKNKNKVLILLLNKINKYSQIEKIN